jgi:large subunit ribosomal protein L4
MIEAPHYAADGAKRGSNFQLPAEYFDGTVNEPVLHQAVKVYLNNQRQGTHMTKSRSFVSGGNQKPWKQKGTGRARQGSIRAPHWRGGGIVFGPTPRDYRTEIPRKVRQLARRSALNARAREGALHVVERLAFRAPKTAQLAGLLGSLGLAGRKALVLTAGHNANAYLSGRNLATVEVMAYPEASAYDILWSDAVVVEEGALTGVMPEPLPEETDAEKAERVEKAERTRRAVAKPTPKAKKPKAEKPSAKVKATKKTTAKKAAPKPAKKKAAPKPKKKGSR